MTEPTSDSVHHADVDVTLDTDTGTVRIILSDCCNPQGNVLYEDLTIEEAIEMASAILDGVQAYLLQSKGNLSK